MKKSKQAKTLEREDGADMISNLPDHVLQLILSRLQGTEEVIPISILSKRWRYLWTSIRSIDIDCNRELEFKRNKFKSFVDHVLESSSLDLDSFRLSCSDHYNQSTIWHWVKAAVARNIKQLDLFFCCGNRYDNIELPNCLVNCDSLEVLRLSLYKERHLSLPKVKGFRALRVVELNKLELSYKHCLVNKILESCPLLEDLRLIDCVADKLEYLCISCPKLKRLRINKQELREYLVHGDLEISCPKLVFLELTGPIAYKYFFNSLDSLKKAVLHPKELCIDSNGRPEPDRMGDTLCDLFASISHVESLSINHFFAGKCIDPDVDVVVSLPNLKTLELTIDCMITDPVKFIKCFPDVESLHLNIRWDANLLECWKLNDDATIRILTRQLKKVDYLYFSGLYSQLELASFFLEHGNALEEMVFCWGDETRFPERSMETMKQVSKFHKASSTVKLITRLKQWNFWYYFNLSSKA